MHEPVLHRRRELWEINTWISGMQTKSIMAYQLRPIQSAKIETSDNIKVEEDWIKRVSNTKLMGLVIRCNHFRKLLL